MKPGSYWGLQDIFGPSSHFKDLKQNFHFYEMLPTRPEDYRSDFRMDPIKSVGYQKTISVLTDNPDHAGQVFVDSAGRKRAFVNVYVLNDTIIFKGLCLICFFFPL